MGQRVFDTIVQTINEIMTQNASSVCEGCAIYGERLAEREKKMAAAIQGELAWLDGEQYEENKFVLSAFLGQITRFAKTEASPKKKEHRSWR